LRNIDACLSRSAVYGELLSRHKRKANVTWSAWMQRTGIMLVAAALCSVAAGCAADTGGTTSGKSDGSGQMRYYGGPKSPMWSDR
jgi:hypothetical protein